MQISDNYRRDSPGFFEDFHPTIGRIDVHFVNHTHWCWTEDDLRTLGLLPSSPGSGSMVRWWVLGTGASQCFPQSLDYLQGRPRKWSYLFGISLCIYAGNHRCAFFSGDSSLVPYLVLPSTPVLYNPSGIVLSDTQQAVLTNLEYFYLRVPSCTALLDSPAHLAAVLEVLAYRFMNVTSDPPITGGV